MAKPRFEQVNRIRFLTTIDFPPFNYLDDNGRLTGFHVDLANAICGELGLLDRCQIQAIPWRELETALQTGAGDAVLAGIAVTAQKRDKFLFTRPYMRFPARFVTPNGGELSEPVHLSVAGRRIGVMAGTAHEAMLRDYFPAARPVTYSRAEWMYAAMRDGDLDGIFGDGLQLSYWLGSSASANCCSFSGGPYVSDHYLGRGLSIAVAGDNQVLVDAFDFALRDLQARGIYAELYLRYFPVSFF
ncbi:MAG: transporter substrate-binding domain-containing protein [Rhizobiaceae bacterium]